MLVNKLLMKHLLFNLSKSLVLSSCQ